MTKMIPLEMIVDGGNNDHYFVRFQNKNRGTEPSRGQRISFRRQKESVWERGIITGIAGVVLLVESK